MYNRCNCKPDYVCSEHDNSTYTGNIINSLETTVEQMENRNHDALQAACKLAAAEIEAIFTAQYIDWECDAPTTDALAAIIYKHVRTQKEL